MLSVCVKAQTVYITKTGKKYHTYTCNFLKYSKKEIELDKAVYLGYTPCKMCKPTGQESATHSSSFTTTTTSVSTKYADKKRVQAVQCSGKTKSGRRCRRKTKNENGRCYQH